MKKIAMILISVLCLVSSGCTGDFEEMNTNPNAFTSLGKKDLEGLFKGAETYAYRFCDHQVTQELFSDLYSQYFATNVSYFSSDRYNYNSSWESAAWSGSYVRIAPNLVTILNNVESNSGEAALSYIIWVYTFHHLVDYHGPIPYEGIGMGDTAPFSEEKDIYYDFFEKLTTAVNNLKALPSGTTIFPSGDLIYSGQIDKWIKFANTLRLRLAMRISNVDPSKARTEAEAAYASGVFASNDDNANYTTSSANVEFLNQFSRSSGWNEFSMSSTIYSYLKGWSDPRLPIYFQPAAGTGQFASIRNGMPAADVVKERNQGVNNSNIGTKWVTYEGTTPSAVLDAPYEIMCYAEALFLRAEGALNGWNMGGDAQSLYEAGVRASMEQWGVEESLIDTYIQSTATPAAPGDYYDSPAVCSLQVKWAGDEKTQRQQIGTQKWLAIYPNGPEGWAEFRRTGYPEMYTIIKSDDNSLPQGTFIQRLRYPDNEYNIDSKELERGIEMLGGVDNQSISLWWAKGK